MKSKFSVTRRSAVHLLAAAAFVVLSAGSAFAVSFKGDTKYQINGSFAYGTFGVLTFLSDSYLRYDVATQKLTVDATVQSNYGQEKYNLNMIFGAAMLTGGAALNNGTPEWDINFPTAAAVTKFAVPPGVVKNGHTMVGTLETQSGFNMHGSPLWPVPAGFDFPILANMPSQIKAQGDKLLFSAWIRTWGDAKFGHHNLHYDAAGDIHSYLKEIHDPKPPKPPTDIPEPMSMSLLATGLLGGACARRRKMKKA